MPRSLKQEWTSSRTQAGVISPTKDGLPPGVTSSELSSVHWTPVQGPFGSLNSEHGDASLDLWWTFEVHVDGDGDGDGHKARFNLYLHKDPSASVQPDHPFLRRAESLMGHPLKLEGWKKWRTIVSTSRTGLSHDGVYAFLDEELGRFLDGPVALPPPPQAQATGETTAIQLGVNPENDRAIWARVGPYGPYVSEAGERGARPRNKALPTTRSIDGVTLDEALELLAVPRAQSVTDAVEPAPAESASGPLVTGPHTVAKRVFVGSKINGYPLAVAVRKRIRERLHGLGFEVYTAESDILNGKRQSHIDEMVETSEHFVAIIWDTVGRATLPEIELAMRVAGSRGAPSLHVFLSTKEAHAALRQEEQPAHTQGFLDLLEQHRHYVEFFDNDKELIEKVEAIFENIAFS